MTAETGQTVRTGREFRWLTMSWWFIAPPMAMLTLSDVREHTFTRYAMGQLPRDFGMQLNPHTDIPLMLLLAAVLLASALWLFMGGGIALYELAAKRPQRRLSWQLVALAVALGLPFVPASAWDEVLLRTVGPGKAAGDLLASVAAQGDVARLRELVARGIAVDAQNHARPADSPALWVAVRNRKLDAVNFLLDRGANPNLGSHFGALPLVSAVKTGDIAIARALIAHGADPCASEPLWTGTRRHEQPSAWSVAQAKGEPEIINILPACPAARSPDNK
jgi:hypothetical protein